MELELKGIGWMRSLPRTMAGTQGTEDGKQHSLMILFYPILELIN